MCRIHNSLRKSPQLKPSANSAPIVKFSLLIVDPIQNDSTATMSISKYPSYHASLLRLSSKITRLKMHSAFLHDQWDSSPPTFRSIYHFSILPRSQINQDYYRGRRPGDAVLSRRRRQADDDFERTQNLLARSMYVPPNEGDSGRRRSRSRRRERGPSSQEQRNTTTPATTIDSSLARQSTASDWSWPEVLLKVILFTVALLLCAPSTLREIPSRDTHGSAARRDSFKEMRYELVPDRRCWGECCLLMLRLF